MEILPSFFSILLFLLGRVFIFFFVQPVSGAGFTPSHKVRLPGVERSVFLFLFAGITFFPFFTESSHPLPRCPCPFLQAKKGVLFLKRFSVVSGIYILCASKFLSLVPLLLLLPEDQVVPLLPFSSAVSRFCFLTSSRSRTDSFAAGRRPPVDTSSFFL